MKKLLLILFIAAAAAAGGWFAARHTGSSPGADARKAAESGGRKVAFYQSPMHPWIKSDKPGNCTICGMKLMPVYEGEKGFGDSAEGMVTLGSNIIQVINVQSEEVKKQPLVRTLRVAGRIESDDTKYRRLSAYVDGRIEKLHVNYVGAEVVAGQPLATIYSPMLLTVESEYLTLLKQRPASGTEDLQKEHTRLLDAAIQRLKRLGYTDEQVQALAGKPAASARSEVVVPMTGTVVMRNVYEGQYVKEGDVLFEIADFNQMWFVVDVYERDLGWLRPGQKVDVTTPAIPGKTFQASIAFIEPNLNDMTRSARVRVVLENPLLDEGGRKYRALLRGMYADGVIKIEVPDVLAIPRSAILAGGPQAIAYVDQGGGAFEQRTLKLGRHGDEMAEVLDGIKEGERVVTTGTLLIDSQAQLNAAASGGTPMPEPAPMAGAENVDALTDAQQQAVSTFLKLASDLGAALAQDSLENYNKIAPDVHAAIPKLLDALASVKALRPALQKLEEDGHLEKAGSLQDARKAFLPFSMAAVQLAKQLRTHDAFKSTKVYNCPMVNQAIPGAAKNGQWVQLQPPLRNPFFGADMLECGTEVK